MSFSRIVEFTTSVVNGLLVSFIYCYTLSQILALFGPDNGIDFSALVGPFIFFMVPVLSLVIGSYAHSIKQKTWGFLLVLISAAVNNFMLLASILHGLGFFYPGWIMLLFVIEFFLVLVVVGAALISKRDRDRAIEIG
jgi:hypothetical protein